jgi:hypothetical protein
MVAAIATGCPTLDGTGLLGQDGGEIAGESFVESLGKGDYSGQFIGQVVRSDGAFTPQPRSQRIEAVPFGKQQCGKAHLGMPIGLGGEIIAIHVHL